ncbi:MAG: hypothetical protein ABR585_07300 [Gemmatimonadaceae bacterium]
MPSHPTPDLINTLKARVRCIIARHDSGLISDTLARTGGPVAAKQDIITDLQRKTSLPLVAPVKEFTDTLRSTGPERVLQLDIYGRAAYVLVTPRGVVDPAAELQAWTRIHDVLRNRKGPA